MGRRGAIARIAGRLAAGALLAMPAAAGADGELDPSFSGDGRLDLRTVGPFVARAMTLQPDRRIVVAGHSCVPDPATRDGTCLHSGAASFRLARLTADGGLDPEFGGGGLVTTRVGTGRSQAFDVLRLPSGELVAGGVAAQGARDVVALARYDAQGALDPAFGQDGVALERIGGGFAAVTALAPGPEDTIYAAGQAGQRMLVARFTAQGRLDGRFGTGGTVLAGPAYGYVTGLAAQPDGGVVAAGVAGTSRDPATYRFGMLRIAADGTAGPVVEQALGTSSSFATAAAPVAGGGFIAAGAATVADGRQAMAVVRGGPDASVAWSSLPTAGAGAFANDVVVVPDGRAYAVGHVALEAGGLGFGATRLLGDGRVDPAFGAGGTTTVTWEQHPYARAMAGAAEPGGALVTAGIGCEGGDGGLSCTGGTAVLLVARQLAAPAATPTPTPTPPVTPVTLRVQIAGVPRRISRAALRRDGLTVRVRVTGPARVRVKVSGTRRTGRGRTLVAATTRRVDGEAAVRLRPRVAALRRTRSGRLRVVARARRSSSVATARSRVLLR